MGPPSRHGRPDFRPQGASGGTRDELSSPDPNAALRPVSLDGHRFAKEGKAQTHLYQLGLLALALNRTLVSPAVRRSRFGLCLPHPFSFYYAPDSLDTFGIRFITLDDFWAWTEKQPSAPSAQVLVLARGDEVMPAKDVALPSSQLCLDDRNVDFSRHEPVAFFSPTRDYQQAVRGTTSAPMPSLPASLLQKTSTAANSLPTRVLHLCFLFRCNCATPFAHAFSCTRPLSLCLRSGRRGIGNAVDEFHYGAAQGTVAGRAARSVGTEEGELGIVDKVVMIGLTFPTLLIIILRSPSRSPPFSYSFLSALHAVFYAGKPMPASQGCAKLSRFTTQVAHGRRDALASSVIAGDATRLWNTMDHFSRQRGTVGGRKKAARTLRPISIRGALPLGSYRISLVAVLL
ncbi:hypothetical protein JCM11641_002823 [Rhodosporidiobolus odoratus]